MKQPESRPKLTRARLALAQESAARAAVQKAADGAAAEVTRINAELQFLRGHSRGLPRRHPAPEGRAGHVRTSLFIFRKTRMFKEEKNRGHPADQARHP